MTGQSLRRRRFYDLVIVLVAVTVSVATSTFGIRFWVYNGWMEYKLICTYSHDNLYEIDLLHSPKLKSQ